MPVQCYVMCFTWLSVLLFYNTVIDDYNTNLKRIASVTVVAHARAVWDLGACPSY